MAVFSQLYHLSWILKFCPAEERTWERFALLCQVPEDLARTLPFFCHRETDALTAAPSLSPRNRGAARKGAEAGGCFWKAANSSLEGRYLEAAEILLEGLPEVSDETEAWMADAYLRFILGCLASVPLQPSESRRLSSYLFLCMQVQPPAVLYAVEPRLMRFVLLKGRRAARQLMDSHNLGLMNILVEFQSMGFPGRCRYKSLSKTAEQGTGLAGLSGEYRRESALFFGAYHTAIGHPRLALDHFLLLSRESSGKEGFADAVYRPWEALAMGMTGDFDLARALLLQSLRLQQGRSTAAVRFLQVYLVHAFLDIRDTGGALEHLDSLLAGTSPAGFAVCWIAANVALARYHAVCGRIRTAWHILYRTLVRANTMGYRYVTPMPFFQELLYELHVAGYPDIPGYACEIMLEQSLSGPNLTFRHVALRLRARGMLEKGNVQGAIAVLKKCRAFFVVHGLVFEAARTIALLACAYLRMHDRRTALRFVIEAWPAFNAHAGLRGLWPQELRPLLPSMPATPSPLRTVPLQRQLMRLLLELDVEGGHFLQKLQEAFCCVLGASRAGFWAGTKEGSPELLGCYGSDKAALSTKERLAVVREAEENIPLLFTLSGREHGGRDKEMGMILPVRHGDDAWYCLYLEGSRWLWSPDDLTEGLLAQLKEMMEIPVRRWLALNASVREGARSHPADELIFVGNVMGDFLEKVDRVADVDASVLIVGETGVGKELVARRLHRGSRRQGPFIAVNLSSIPEELFESEMLGYEKGAFTGANRQKKGILELVDGGTLFLDELPDISPRFQAKLLRILQERNFMRLGGTQTIHSDFRLVAASNKDMKEEVRQGRFRADLYYRICVVSLHVPPLRERREDILAIAGYYLRHYCGQYRRVVPELKEEDREKLRSYAWPGNIRELRNIMAQAAALSTPEHLYISLDSPDISPSVSVKEERTSSAMPETPSSVLALLEEMPTLEQMERRYIQEILKLTNGRISGPRGAATLLGINRTTLYKKMKE